MTGPLPFSTTNLARLKDPRLQASNGKQRLLSARIGALYLTHQRRGVVLVEPVQKYDARVAVFPGLFHQGTDTPPWHPVANRFFAARINQIIVASVIHGLDKGIRDAHRNIEIVQRMLVLFADK